MSALATDALEFRTHTLSPLTPSLVAFHKRPGQLVARDDEQIGEQLYRGQYTSPSLGVVNGRAQILFATGNGVCYAFEPVDPAARVVPDRWMNTRLRGPIVYFIDVEGKDTGGLTAAEYARTANLLADMPKPALPLEFRFSRKVPAMTPVDTIPTASVPDVPVLKKIWWFDCIPAEYKRHPFYPRQIKGDGRGHPCDIIGTPVFSNNRVYIAIGGDPNQGGRDAKGCNVAIDATKTGDVTEKGKIWSYEGLNQRRHRGGADGLVLSWTTWAVHCLDADSSKCCWIFCSKRRNVLQFTVGGGWEAVCGKDHLVGQQEVPVVRWHQEWSEHGIQQPLCCQWRGICRDRRTSLGAVQQGRSEER